MDDDEIIILDDTPPFRSPVPGVTSSSDPCLGLFVPVTMKSFPETTLKVAETEPNSTIVSDSILDEIIASRLVPSSPIAPQPVSAQPSSKKKNKQCLNKVCRRNEPLKRATEAVVSFFEKNFLEKKKYYVCESCELASDLYEQKLVDLVLGGKHLIDHNIDRPCDLVDLDMDDEEDEYSLDEIEEDDESEFEKFEINGDISEIIDEIFDKYNCNRELEEGVDLAKRKLKNMDERQIALEEFSKKFQHGIDELSKTFYGAFDAKITHLPPIDLDDDATLLAAKNRPSKTQKIDQFQGHTMGLDLAAQLIKSKPGAGNVRHLKTNSSTSTEGPDIEAITATSKSNSKVKLPPSGDLVRMEPVLGETVYVMTKTLRDTWKKGKVIGREEQDGVLMYRVRITENLKKLVSPKHMAYLQVPAVTVPHGTRIIAMYKDENDINVGYYAGIVAENLKHINNFRYLIFFDDGFAQYSLHADVRVVCEQSHEVWNDLELEARNFTQTYLQQYPERPMVKLQPGQVVKTEFLKKWYVARVQSVDASLAQMAFETCDGRVEWIYRGSTRLAPLYNELIQRPKAQQKLLSNQPKPNAPVPVQVKEMPLAAGREEVETLGLTRAVAKKSTSKKPSQTYVDESIEKVDRIPSRYKISSEHDGKVQSIKNFPLKTDVKFSRHQCGPPCIKYHEYDPQSNPPLKRMNLLLIPLKLGWVRKVAGIQLQSNRLKVPSDVVIYRAPCGRHLRSPEDVLRYLRVTHSNMPIDMFTFDVAVRTNVEFAPAKVLWEHADISYGKEPMPVCAVNSIDRTAPDYVAYSTVRIPSKGVKMNLNPEFLSCCSCKDDCQNRDKCECQQLTVQGLSMAERILISNAGYQYRRLSEQIVTGVYECNEKCPCKKTCLNRVVQFPLRVRLQLFKTEKRGWGIRTLDDLPSGSFICVYAGQLLTDQEANIEGITAGDEYFADLDFIEVAEKVKEGYESDVDMSDEDSYPSQVPEREPSTAQPKNKSSDKEYRPGFPATSVAESSSDSSVRRSTRDRRKPSNESDNPSKKKKGRKGKKSKSQSVSQAEIQRNQIRINFLPTRELFGKEELAYTMDAKTVGNIGRYLNHSCNPNVFVQNVFVDTHDLRFPWVAFFANSHIAAGSELMWDYSYEVDSVPGKKLSCYCGAENCRGRLL